MIKFIHSFKLFKPLSPREQSFEQLFGLFLKRVIVLAGTSFCCLVLLLPALLIKLSRVEHLSFGFCLILVTMTAIGLLLFTFKTRLLINVLVQLANRPNIIFTAAAIIYIPFCFVLLRGVYPEWLSQAQTMEMVDIYTRHFFPYLSLLLVVALGSREHILNKIFPSWLKYGYSTFEIATVIQLLKQLDSITALRLEEALLLFSTNENVGDPQLDMTRFSENATNDLNYTLTAVHRYFEITRHGSDKKVRFQVSLSEVVGDHAVRLVGIFPGSDRLVLRSSVNYRSKLIEQTIATRKTASEERWVTSRQEIAAIGSYISMDDVVKKGSAMCIPIFGTPAQKVNMILSVCASKKDYFKDISTEIEKYELLMQPFVTRLKIHFAACTLNHNLKRTTMTEQREEELCYGDEHEKFASVEDLVAQVKLLVETVSPRDLKLAG